MTFTPPANGTLNWDIPLNTALSQLGNRWLPDDYGFLSWTIDPSQASGTSLTTAGSVHMIGVNVRQTASISNVIMHVGVAGVTLTAAQNFAGVYNSSGARVGVTADQSGVWTSTGTKIMALTASFVATPGTYYIAVVTNGTTQPQFSQETTVGPINAGLVAATFRSSIGATAQTTLPVSITMGTRTASTISWWGAVS